MAQEFKTSEKPRIFEIEDPAGGHLLVGVSVDEKYSQVGTCPNLGTTIDSIIDSSFLDAKYAGMFFVRAQPAEGGGFTLIFKKLPGTTLTGEEVSSQYGGGILRTTQQDVAPGTTVNGGLKVVSATVAPDGKGMSVLTKAELPEGEEWPVLFDSEFDQRMMTMVQIEKTVIAPGSVVPSVSGNQIVEVRSLDKWHSIQIVSKFDFDLLNTVRRRRITTTHSFPGEITRCQWKIAINRKSFVTGGNVNDEVTSFDLGLDLALKGRYSGSINAILEERVTTNPEEALPEILRFYEVGGVLTLGYLSSGLKMDGANVRSFTIPESLHPAISPDLPVLTNTASGSGIDGISSYSAVTWDPAISIPASNPISLPAPGTQFVKDVDMESWRFGAFVRSVLWGIVPQIESGTSEDGGSGLPIILS